MSKTRILVIEDEEDILALIHYNLMKEGFEVASATHGEQGLQKARTELPDLIVLDLMLPGVDGLEICRALRADTRTAGIPVIMLTAKAEEEDILHGLERGADDYITKPFSHKVLVARVRSVLRRRETDPPPTEEAMVRGPLVIHPGRNEVWADGRLVELTYTEFRLLQLLAGRPGWVFSRSQIVDALHGDDYAVTERAVDVQIVGLRKKLGAQGALIETVRGLGYRFKDHP